MTAGYIIEFRQVGSLIKVSAVDPATLKEISIVLPAGKNISRDDMCKMAVRRLEYVIKKKKDPIS